MLFCSSPSTFLDTFFLSFVYFYYLLEGLWNELQLVARLAVQSTMDKYNL